MVVLSPPGRIRPLTPSRSAGRRTSTPSTPIAARVAMCSRKAPWRASTPILTAGLPRALRAGSSLPAPHCEALPLGDCLERDPAHRRAEALADLGEDLGVVVVGRGLDDGLAVRPVSILRSQSDEDAVGTTHASAASAGWRSGPRIDRALPAAGPRGPVDGRGPCATKSSSSASREPRSRRSRPDVGGRPSTMLPCRSPSSDIAAPRRSPESSRGRGSATNGTLKACLSMWFVSTAASGLGLSM